jgi:hypothetical protein
LSVTEAIFFCLKEAKETTDKKYPLRSYSTLHIFYRYCLVTLAPAYGGILSRTTDGGVLMMVCDWRE